VDGVSGGQVCRCAGMQFDDAPVRVGDLDEDLVVG
jgi:hypothetical protein